MATLTTEWQELGSVTFYSTSNASDTIAIDGKYSSQNTTNNSSIINLRFRNKGSSWSTTNGEVAFTGTYSDSASCATYPNIIHTGDTIFEISKTLYHDSNGNASILVGGTIYAYIRSARRSGTISNITATLPQIKRASIWSSSLLSIPDIENGFTLPITKYVSDYYNVVEVRNNNNTILVKTINNANNGDSVTFTSSELNTIFTMDNNRNQLPLRFFLDLKTYTNSSKTTQIGTTQRLTCEAYIVNGEPTATYTIEEQDSKVISLLGRSTTNKVIKNASDLLFTITPTAKKGATIFSVKINDASASLSSGNYVLNITDITTGTFNIVVTDSRGLSTPYSVSKTLLDYVAVKINSWNVERATQVSSDLVLNANITCYNGSVNGTTNTPTIRYSLDNETWTQITNYTFNNNTITINDLLLEDIIDYKDASKFYIDVFDLLSEDKQNTDISKGVETFSYGENDLQVNGQLYVANEDGESKKEIRDLIYPIGSIYLSVNNVNPTNLFGGTWIAFGTGRTLVGVDTSQIEFNTVEKTGGEKTHTLTINEMPSHNHDSNGWASVTDGSGKYNVFGAMNGGGKLVPTRNTGGGQPHNILQPYVTCYMWKRTA